MTDDEKKLFADMVRDPDRYYPFSMISPAELKAIIGKLSKESVLTPCRRKWTYLFPRKVKPCSN